MNFVTNIIGLFISLSLFLVIVSFTWHLARHRKFDLATIKNIVERNKVKFIYKMVIITGIAASAIMLTMSSYFAFGVLRFLLK